MTKRSVLTTVQIDGSLSERFAFKVSIPLHQSELEDTVFLDSVIRGIRSMEFPSFDDTSKMRSVYHIHDHVVAKVSTFLKPLDDLPVSRKVSIELTVATLGVRVSSDLIWE